jgi:protein-tyrosine kinase
MTLRDTQASSHDLRKSSRALADRTLTANGEVATVGEFGSPHEQLMMAYDAFDPRCEKIRVLRTELLLRRDSIDRADIVALLSPCSGEGRSLLVAELAVAFAQTGRATLLVDADLRNPRQHALFNIRNRQGLSEAIEHGAEPPIHAVKGLPHLSVLTAGAIPSNPLELLSSTSFASMLADWRETYKFVVLDTAPATYFSDGLAVASLVGRVLVLSRAQTTRYKDMQEMLRRLAATRSQILGAVLSHF